MSDVERLLAPTVDGMRRVFCCHRSVLSGRFPANSAAAVRECVEARVPRLEFDVWVLPDGEFLVFHDDILERETDGLGAVAGMSRSELSLVRYPAGGGLTFLDEVVESARGSSTLLQVDLKGFTVLPRDLLDGLAKALEPVAGHTIVGSMAHWNLRPLAEAGMRVAFDPTLQWHAAEWARQEELLGPKQLGVHGLWDDAPLAAVEGVSARDYVEARIDDLTGMLPAVEWMVDWRTLFHLQSLGCDLGWMLRERGVSLAAWTLLDEGREEVRRKLERLFGLGAETVISRSPLVVAGYWAS